MAGGVRVSVALDDNSLEWSPTWTDLTATDNLVAGYDIRRGRQFETDKNDPSEVTVKINDIYGVLDPTNSSGPYYGKIDPLRQIKVELWNPVTSEWKPRFRGFIEDFDYVLDPSQRVMQLQITCVDLTAILTAIEMQPGQFGITPATSEAGNIVFAAGDTAHDRIAGVLTDAGLPTDYYVVFTLNVTMQRSIYSPSENVLLPIQDAADAEFPTVSNEYIDRLGRLSVHGRLAKFDPDGTAASATPGAWDFTHWKCGDGAAVALSPSDTAQIRTFAFNRGLSKVFNSALCTPNNIDNPPTVSGVSDIPGQLKTDATSIGIYGIRSWSAENLLIDSGDLTGNTGLEECALFAEFIETNYKEPRNRITDLSFKSIHPDDPRAAAVWDLLCNVDIADMIDVTVANPGGGGFNAEPGFVEGITESCEPLNADFAMVTTSLDVSPQAYFSNPVGLDG
jgi:hypothetical protein